MKKILSIVIAAALLVSTLAACSNDSDNGENNNTTTTSAATENTDNTSDTTENTESTSDTAENTEATTEDSADNTASAGETSKILAAIRDAYGDNYLPNMEIPEEYLNATLGIEQGTYTEFSAEMPMISAHPDLAVIVKAADGKAADVKEKLEAYRTYLIEESMQYPMNQAKVNAVKIVENGDYLALLLLGEIDDREDASDDDRASFAEEQVQIGVDAFNAYFN